MRKVNWPNKKRSLISVYFIVHWKAFHLNFCSYKSFEECTSFEFRWIDKNLSINWGSFDANTMNHFMQYIISTFYVETFNSHTLEKPKRFSNRWIRLQIFPCISWKIIDCPFHEYVVRDISHKYEVALCLPQTTWINHTHCEGGFCVSTTNGYTEYNKFPVWLENRT